MPPRLAYYLTYIGLFTGPLALLIALRLWKRWGRSSARKLLAAIAPVNVALVAAMNYTVQHPHLDLGELKLGYVEDVLPPVALWVVQFIGIAAGEVIVAGLVQWAYRRPWPNGVVAVWTVSVLFADSFWRGAQRYAVYLLPGLVMFLSDAVFDDADEARGRAR